MRNVPCTAERKTSTRNSELNGKLNGVANADGKHSTESIPFPHNNMHGVVHPDESILRFQVQNY